MLNEEIVLRESCERTGCFTSNRMDRNVMECLNIYVSLYMHEEYSGQVNLVQGAGSTETVNCRNR